MIRMALTHAVRRGLAASTHTHWRGESIVAGEVSEGDVAMPPAPLLCLLSRPSRPGFMPIPPQLASLAFLATPAFRAAFVALHATSMLIMIIVYDL